MLLTLKIIAVTIGFVGSISLAFMAWRRVPISKKDQKVYLYIAALLLLVMSALMLFYGAS